jgi:outer membrane protein OmpA-like peptidoglycan-associated protein
MPTGYFVRARSGRQSPLRNHIRWDQLATRAFPAKMPALLESHLKSAKPPYCAALGRHLGTTVRVLACSLAASVALGALGCSSGRVVKEKQPDAPPPGLISVVKYEKKTAQLMDATLKLGELRDNVDEQRRRLQVICADYPDHLVCQPQTAAEYARKAFCADQEFTKHVDAVVNSCHQGACKQVDEANLITRVQYMTLVQRLPHALVLFGRARTKLDRKDKKQIQQFVETIGADKGGYIIIVGRASKDGSWRKNLKLALDRAEHSRAFIVDQLGIEQNRVGYITYGHAKMYLTALDAERLTKKKLSTARANRSALLFAYPCFNAKRTR